MNKSVSFVGEDKNTTVIDGNGIGTVVYVTANQFYISGFTIQHGGSDPFDSGIYLHYSNKSTISDNNIASNHELGVYLSHLNNSTLTNNTIKDNGYGIYVVYSENSTICDNTVIAGINSVDGISILASNKNTIINNTVSNFFHEGICIYYSSDNILRLNNMTGNGFNFGVYGTSLLHYIQDIDSSNKVDKKSIYYLVNQHNKQVPSDAGYVAVVNSTNITVKNLDLRKNEGGVIFVYTTNSKVENVTASDCCFYGICLYYSDNITIIRNTISNNYEGVSLDHSNRNTIDSNLITSNWAESGVSLEYSHNNIITKNDVTYNYPFGIKLRYSDGNTISENVVSNNQRGADCLGSWDNVFSSNTITHQQLHGIVLDSGGDNTIIGNTISDNRDGINLEKSDGNTIVGNNVTSNARGIGMGWTGDNKIYHNNFVNNTEQAFIYDSPNNVWDAGYPLGGNYWSNYTGVDLYTGPYQNMTGSDGIGDTPHIIDADNRDNYPLMKPYSGVLTVAGDFGTISGGYYDFDYKCDYHDLFLFRKALVIQYHQLCDFDKDLDVDYMDLFQFRKCYIDP